MGRLLVEIEKLGGKFFSQLKEHTMRKSICGNGMNVQGQELAGSICYLYKHCSNIAGDHWVKSLRYDVIRMLIRGSDYSHTLCLHVCDGSSEFHVYSKKGWVSLCPEKDAMVITIGDQVQGYGMNTYHMDGFYKVITGSSAATDGASFEVARLQPTVAPNAGKQNAKAAQKGNSSDKETFEESSDDKAQLAKKLVDPIENRYTNKIEEDSL